MENIREIFDTVHENDHYQRIAVSLPVAWYAGKDPWGRKSLFCITETEPAGMDSSKIINVFVGTRKDNRIAITFSLLDDKYLDMFLPFCRDMVDFSKKLTHPDRAADGVRERYLQWQKVFKRNNGELLSFEEVKGLIGELCFLKMKMFPLYGISKALDAWSGIERTDQDFRCDDTWYEVKSTVSGASSVKISSVEQLDTDNDGHLVVVMLDKTSEADASRLTLNSMYKMILDSIPAEETQERFKNRMLTYGYYLNKAYDKIGFHYNGMSIYRVDATFPCLRKAEMPVSVQNAKYELSLPAIDIYKEN